MMIWFWMQQPSIIAHITLSQIDCTRAKHNDCDLNSAFEVPMHTTLYQMLRVYLKP